MEVWLGALVVLITAAAAVRRRLWPTRAARAGLLTPSARRGLLALLCVASAVLAVPSLFPALRSGIFSFCSVCPVASPLAQVDGARPPFSTIFLQGVWYYTATVLPVFVLASLLSGLLIVRSDRFRVRGVLGAFAAAALLPVCSCGVIPLARPMLGRGGSGIRDGLVFLATAPLLSPVIVGIALTALGPAYTALRVAASLTMALVIAAVVAPFVRAPGPATTGAPDGHLTSRRGGGSVMSEGWTLMAGLVPYVLYGVVLGSLVTAALPPGYVRAVLGTGPLSLAAAVVVGVPINMCAGEEVLLVAPFVELGFTMGHAVAFSLASAGICLGSIPLLGAMLGRRATVALVTLYLLVPFALGFIIDGVAAAAGGHG